MICHIRTEAKLRELAGMLEFVANSADRDPRFFSKAAERTRKLADYHRFCVIGTVQNCRDRAAAANELSEIVLTMAHSDSLRKARKHLLRYHGILRDCVSHHRAMTDKAAYYESAGQ